MIRISDTSSSDDSAIGSFLFFLYLQVCGLIKTARFDNKVLVVLALLVASSDPVQKEVLIQLIINLLDATGGKGKGRDVSSEHYAKNTYCPWRRANLLNRRLRSSICNHQVALSFRMPQLTGHSGQLLW